MEKQKSESQQKKGTIATFVHHVIERRWIVVACVGIIALTLTGIGIAAARSKRTTTTSQPVVERTNLNTNTVPVAPTPEPTEIPRQLDGVIVPRASADLFPVAVMLDNNPAALPHAGIAKASVVYDTMVEGGATRLMAVFSSDLTAGRIGPIRSARPYYLEWLSEYNALYMHAGGSPAALEQINSIGAHDLNCIAGGARYCFRDTTSYAPHNLFTDDEKVSLALSDMKLTDIKPTFDTWRFKDDDALAGRGSFSTIDVAFSSLTYNVHYDYDRENNVYLRSQAGAAYTDRSTGEQVAVKNVIVQVLPEIEGVGEKGRLDLTVTGSGRAVLFRDGLIIDGTWEKPTRVDRTVFRADDGTPMKLNRGQTWIEALPEPREFSYE